MTIGIPVFMKWFYKKWEFRFCRINSWNGNPHFRTVTLFHIKRESPFFCKKTLFWYPRFFVKRCLQKNGNSRFCNAIFYKKTRNSMVSRFFVKIFTKKQGIHGIPCFFVKLFTKKQEFPFFCKNVYKKTKVHGDARFFVKKNYKKTRLRGILVFSWIIHEKTGIPVFL